jgi:hypothetical protein
MSFHAIREIEIQPDEVRNFYLPYTGSDTKKIFDLWKEWRAIGLDLMIHNRGTSDITFDVDASGVKITVEAGDSISLSNFKYSLVEISNSAGVTFEVIMLGVKR